MTVDAAVGAAFERIASREHDAMHAFDPSVAPENGDVAIASDATQPVLDPLSVALPDRAYVLITGDRGEAVYARDGRFHIRDGCLVDASDRPVRGYVSAKAPLSDLRVDSIDRALERVGGARIEPDGRVTYARSAIDPRSGERIAERVAIGRIALARFPAGTAFRSVDAFHVRAPDGVVPHVGVPGDGSFAALEPMRANAPRIDIDASLIKLKEAYMALDALRAARRAQGGAEKSAMDLLK